MYPPTFPTDREEDAPDLGVGIDTVAVMGETTEAMLFELREHTFDREVDRRTGAVTETQGFSDGKARIGLACCRLFGWRRDGLAWLRVELSLPTMLYGHNRNALDRTLLTEAVDTSLTVLAETYSDIPPVDRTVVQRLDLARDFVGVESTDRTLTALAHRHIAYARFNESHRRPDGTMQSLTRGSKNEYLVRGYDKAYELLDKARTDRAGHELLIAWASVSGGRFRFELELRRPLLRRKGLIRMTDFTPDVIDGLARHYFEHAGWADPYGGRGRVQQTLEQLRPSLSRADFRSLCSFLYSVERGIEVDLSRHVLDRIRPLVRKHNLLDIEDDGEVRRLDFDAGREIPAD